VYSKLEEREVQLLMDEKIKEKVVGFIKPDLVNDINSELKTYLEGIQEHLVDYIYKPERQKEKLTSADFAEKIVDAYFATKKLHYKKSEKQLVPGSDLSSGEKRRALIDVAYAFLKKRSPSDSHQVVLAIDEPDASLHISACYDQFEKVKEISRQGHQTLVATHWYGFLPVAESGIGHAIEKDIHDAVTVTSFDLYEYSSSIKSVVKASKNAVPVDVHLKSYNDLVQSVVASVLHERPYRWIFCEGLSDKIYLEHFLSLLSKKQEQTSRLRIVPLGGAKEVRRVFQYIERPLTDDSYTINGRIVCLVDTDAQMLSVSPVNSPKANLEFRRLLLTENNTKISLEKGNSSQVAPETTIEDCLPGNAFQITLKKFVSTYPSLTPILAKAKEGKASLAGGINLDKVQIATLKSFFAMDNGAMKVEFARAFVFVNKDLAEIPDWIKELKKLLPEFKPKT